VSYGAKESPDPNPTKSLEDFEARQRTVKWIKDNPELVKLDLQGGLPPKLPRDWKPKL
jgi:hypothetical protein